MPTLRFRTAGVRVDLRCASGAVHDLVAQVGAGMLDADPRGEGPRVVLDESSLDLPTDADPEQRASRLLAAVERSALAASPALLVHAAALGEPDGCVIVPGASGAGKTTLAAAALQQGLTLLSDEAACLMDPVGMVLPHPRPLTLSRHSRNLLGVDEGQSRDEEIGLAPQEFGLCANPSTLSRCVAVVVPSWQAGARTEWQPVDRSVGLVALLGAVLDGGWPPALAWEYLTRLVGSTLVARLSYDHPRDGAELLTDVLAHASLTRPGL